MPAYTVLSVVAVLGVVLLERLRWRTGVLRTTRYWQALAIIAFFMVLVDGWLTWPGRAVVVYDPGAIIGLRVPWGIPVEDYGFGWAMVTLTILQWERRGARERRSSPQPVAQDRLEESGV
ncbi:MAG: lycopene cyclase [Nocardioides sp.]|jgi:lycopene cyclase domain-containing protein|nr:lycopene cyclase [Nocardioides sp.]